MYCRLILFGIFLSFSVGAHAYSEKHNRLIEEARSKMTSDNEVAQKRGLSALSLARAENDTTLIALSLRTLGTVYYFAYDIPEASNYFKKALVLYRQLQDSVGISACYTNLGRSYMYLGNYWYAEYYFHKALSIDKNLADIQGQAVVLNNLGELYHLQERYYLALYYYYASLKLEIKMANKTGMADSYNNLGTLLKDVEMFEAAQKYYALALEIYEDKENLFRLGQIYNNIGFSYFMQQEYYKARDAYKKSLHYKNQTGDMQGLITTNLNIGNLYILKSDTVQAIAAFKNAVGYENQFYGIFSEKEFEKKINSFEKIDDFFFYLISLDVESGYYFGAPERLYYRGYIHKLIGEYDIAVSYFLNSLEILERYEIYSLLKKNYKSLSNIYYERGDYENAMRYNRLYSEIIDVMNRQSINDFHNLYLSELSLPLFSNPMTDFDEETSVKATKAYRSFWFYSTVLLLIIVFVLIIKRKG